MKGRKLGWLAAALAPLGCAGTSPQRHGPMIPPEMAGPAIALVDRQLAAYNARDLDGFVGTYADDVQVVSAATGAVLVSGHPALRARYAGIFEKYPRNHAVVVERRTEGGGVVLDHEVIAGRAPEKPDPWDAGWVRYEVEGGLIRRVVLP